MVRCLDLWFVSQAELAFRGGWMKQLGEELQEMLFVAYRYESRMMIDLRFALFYLEVPLFLSEWESAVIRLFEVSVNIPVESNN